jgi:hypothetical protein
MIENSPPTDYACLHCKRYTLFSWPRTCDAFPNGIPKDILDGTDKHTKSVRGDHGLTFLPMDEVEHNG